MYFKKSETSVLRNLVFIGAVFFWGFATGVSVTNLDSIFDIKNIIIVLSSTTAIFSIFLIYFISNQYKINILKTIFCCSLVILFAFPFCCLLSQKKNIETNKSFKIHLYHGLDLNQKEKQYLTKLKKDIQELNYNSTMFKLISLRPDIINSELMKIQIRSHEKIIDNIKNAKPPRSFNHDHLLLFSIASTQLYCLKQYKENVLMDTTFSNKCIRDMHFHKCEYLENCLYYKVQEI